MPATLEPSAPIHDRGLLTLKEATAWLALKDERVVMRMVREGQLSARRIGRRVFITTASLEKFAGVLA